jgi:hypothetical protein
MEHLIESGLADIQKAKISEIVGDSDMKVLQGGDEELNLMHTLISIGQVIKA